MSYYTKFQDVESILSGTSTATLGSTDVVLGFSFTDGKAHQMMVGHVGAAGGLQTLTSASTATNIVPNGITTINSSNALSYLLTAPTAAGAGFMKTIVTSSTAVITVVCSGASLSSTGAINGTQFILNSAGGALSGGGIQLASVGSTRWITVGYSGTTVLS